MAATHVSDDVDSLAGFTGKWRQRWPEWRVAEVFVPAANRDLAVAWFALRQELTDAAWGGGDPRPGEAKLAWWSEELAGWTQGRRRHPLGLALQQRPVPWSVLGASLPALQASRDRPATAAEAAQAVEPFARAVGRVAASLFASRTPAPTRGIVAGLLAERLLQRGEAGVPLETLARHQAPEAALRARARELLQDWPLPYDGTPHGRVHAALVRQRLQGLADGRPRDRPAPPWRALLAAWRAARASSAPGT
jgi:phytoene/squalene synthetase